MGKPLIYLDYNATAPLRPQAYEAMQEILKEPLNASAVHGYGRTGRKIVEKSRVQVAALAGVDPAMVIFNSGASEGNNTILQHFAGERVLVSAIEHISVIKSAPQAGHVHVTPDGVIDLDALEGALKAEKTALVSVMAVNNETGVVQPVKEVAALAHQYGALFHCDAVHAMGRIPFDMREVSIDFLTISAHKIGGAQGVGALAIGLCGITPTLLHGGGQEKSARAGTENIAGIAAFGAAAEACAQSETFRNNILEQWIRENGGIIHGDEAERVSNTTFFSFPGIKAQTAMMAMDLAGFAISNGSACSSGSVKPSRVLQAMGVEGDALEGAIRVSTGWNSSKEDIERFIEAFSKFMKN